jgi:hypothetical protein
MLGLDILLYPARAFALKNILKEGKILMTTNYVKNPQKKKKIHQSVPSLSLAKILEDSHPNKKLLMGEIKDFSHNIDRASIIPTIETIRSSDFKSREYSDKMTEIIIKGLCDAVEKLDQKKDTPILKYFQRTILAKKPE